MVHSLSLKITLTCILFTLISLTAWTAEIIPDSDPIPGPGKITSTGNWSVIKNKEVAGSVKMSVIPSGGNGGIGKHKYTFVDFNKENGTYAITVDNLEEDTEYDVIIFLQYVGKTTEDAVYTKTYKVKTQKK